jgi:hypothetical protein
MIQIHINPARVERVIFDANSDVEEDFDFAAWQAIRPLVAKIDERLGQIIADLSINSKLPPTLNTGPGYE